jgi:cell division protein ZapA (FtsZ GTPase activity inhibitor)
MIKGFFKKATAIAATVVVTLCLTNTSYALANSKYAYNPNLDPEKKPEVSPDPKYLKNAEEHLEKINDPCGYQKEKYEEAQNLTRIAQQVLNEARVLNEETDDLDLNVYTAKAVNALHGLASCYQEQRKIQQAEEREYRNDQLSGAKSMRRIFKKRVEPYDPANMAAITSYNEKTMS